MQAGWSRAPGVEPSLAAASSMPSRTAHFGCAPTPPTTITTPVSRSNRFAYAPDGLNIWWPMGGGGGGANGGKPE